MVFKRIHKTLLPLETAWDEVPNNNFSVARKAHATRTVPEVLRGTIVSRTYGTHKNLPG